MSGMSWSQASFLWLRWPTRPASGSLLIEILSSEGWQHIHLLGRKNDKMCRACLSTFSPCTMTATCCQRNYFVMCSPPSLWCAPHQHSSLERQVMPQTPSASEGQTLSPHDAHARPAQVDSLRKHLWRSASCIEEAK